MQSKYSLVLKGAVLEFAERGGEYILKPYVPGEFENMEAMPANEHATMQIAARVFNMNVAENCLVFFKDEETPAYLTRRFDALPEGKRLQQEDFAQIAGVSEETNGKSYKYDLSYEKIAMLMKAHVSAYAVEAEKYFRLVVFNYLVHNGDAHLKNFSLIRDPALNAYLLTPAYDLLNTRMHLPYETALALDLFEGSFETESYKINGFYSRDDFFEFGRRIGIQPKRIGRFLDEFTAKDTAIADMVDRSFLDDARKTRYMEMIRERVEALRYSYRQSNNKKSGL
ncbi:MAG: HipA domain-containing protein [Chitinispirillaceae bacterium]|nr:HipA domain-containing protein [Chitinispirillaceae bacterium]